MTVLGAGDLHTISALAALQTVGPGEDPRDAMVDAVRSVRVVRDAGPAPSGDRTPRGASSVDGPPGQRPGSVPGRGPHATILRAVDGSAQIVTLLHGRDVSADVVAGLIDAIRDHAPSAEVLAVDSGRHDESVEVGVE
ncbi:hypothetical protein GCM10025865_24010 [Paraoerskovia sediminicola]|uniref:Transposase n=1 Tax=Paraoerskovia sediminicola TaxID=1138587 RepID=A0ABM8G4J5_9CELL|nr:hypothetical protein [Paraoerskovia sediminicola]BDZ43102.1 hypothetical protein GCM10025865_24010 [Paraoerskovia sediminicola]